MGLDGANGVPRANVGKVAGSFAEAAVLGRLMREGCKVAYRR